MLNIKDMKQLIELISKAHKYPKTHTDENILSYAQRQGIYIAMSTLNSVLNKRFKSFNGYTHKELANFTNTTIKE